MTLTKSFGSDSTISYYGSQHSIPSSTSRHFERFSYNLGHPPGSENVKKTKRLPKSTSDMPKYTRTQKIAPMKELEKMMTDLKKENFDLKLRLYHSETIITRDETIHQLRQEVQHFRKKLSQNHCSHKNCRSCK